MNNEILLEKFFFKEIFSLLKKCDKTIKVIVK